MVAITVILAAVIAAFVFGLAGTTGSSKNVAMTVTTPNSTFFQVTVQGGTDLPTLTYLNWSIDGGTAEAFAQSTTDLTVGRVLTQDAGETITGGHRIIITGKFDDGTSTVLFDKTF